jgi:hypothetical protein
MWGHFAPISLLRAVHKFHCFCFAHISLGKGAKQQLSWFCSLLTCSVAAPIPGCHDSKQQMLKVSLAYIPTGKKTSINLLPSQMASVNEDVIPFLNSNSRTSWQM